MSDTPETDQIEKYDGFKIKDTVTTCGDESSSVYINVIYARQLERERDEARDANKKLREVLEWISERYDDSKPMHQVAMDAYEMSCAARAILQKE